MEIAVILALDYGDSRELSVRQENGHPVSLVQLEVLLRLREQKSLLLPVGTPWEAFKKAYGHVKFTKSSEAGNLCLGGTGSVSCFSGTDLTSRLLTHELGHAFSWAHGTDPYGRLEDEDAQIVDDRGNWVTGKHTGGDFERTILGYKSGGEPDMYHGPEDWTDWNSNADNLARNEDYADMFMNWVYDSFDYRANAYNAGTYRYEWMTTNVAEFVR
jgi:hypothetical protein